MKNYIVLLVQIEETEKEREQRLQKWEEYLVSSGSNDSKTKSNNNSTETITSETKDTVPVSTELSIGDNNT